MGILYLYTPLVQWYCEECGDEGEAESQFGAERQATDHRCEPKDRQ